MRSNLALLLLLASLVACPAANDDDATANDDDATANDDDATADDDDATGDDDDATGDDDDATGDDDDATGDDDDSATSGEMGACRFSSGGVLAACESNTQANCEVDGAPKGITLEWVDEPCPGNATASCVNDGTTVNWFYYLGQGDGLLEPWCSACISTLDPAGYCDSVGGIGGGGGDDDDSGAN